MRDLIFCSEILEVFRSSLVTLNPRPLAAEVLEPGSLIPSDFLLSCFADCIVTSTQEIVAFSLIVIVHHADGKSSNSTFAPSLMGENQV